MIMNASGSYAWEVSKDEKELINKKEDRTGKTIK